MLKLTIALAFALTAAAQVEIAVHINNNAGLAPAQVNKAMKIAGRVFVPLGIAVRWSICDPSCTETGTLPTFIMGIAGPQLEMPVQASLGFAMLATGKGNRAAVSLPRIEDFAEANSVPMESVLGYSIAHELGHMITRSTEHSSGVMRAKWDKENAMRMGQIRLEFAAKDGAAMKAALQSRVSPARVTE
jgi:hypothetical protein